MVQFSVGNVTQLKYQEAVIISAQSICHHFISNPNVQLHQRTQILEWPNNNSPNNIHPKTNLPQISSAAILRHLKWKWLIFSNGGAYNWGGWHWTILLLQLHGSVCDLLPEMKICLRHLGEHVNEKDLITLFLIYCIISTKTPKGTLGTTYTKETSIGKK